MSTRAEALDEERKKAEMSLEGLKTKLKNLEEVRLFHYRSYLISPHKLNRIYLLVRSRTYQSFCSV